MDDLLYYVNFGLAYVFVALPYAIALSLGIAVMVCGLFCHAHFGAGLAAILGVFALEGLYMSLGGINLGVSLYVTDLVMVFMAVVTLLRFHTRREVGWPNRWWLLFMAVFFVNLLTGIAQNGSAAGVQARPQFYSIVAACYPMSFKMTADRVRRVIQGLVLLATTLVALCVYRWVVYYAPIPGLLPEGGTYNVDGAIRVIRSHETLLVAQVLVLGLFFSRLSTALLPARFATPLWLAAVIALQHRSVWVSTLAGLLAALLLSRSTGRSRLTQALLLAGSFAVVILPMTLSSSLSGVTQQVSKSAGAAVAVEGTANERVNSWQAILVQWAGAGARSIVIGRAAGYDSTRSVKDDRTGAMVKIDYTAHNHYVQLLASMGLVGLGSFLMLLMHLLRGLAAQRNGETSVAASAWMVLMVMQIVYYIPYSTDYLQHLLMGVCAAWLATAEHAQRQPRREARPHPRWASEAVFTAAAAAAKPSR